MTHTNNTTLITSENVNWMKVHVLKMYGIGNVYANYLEVINEVTSMFDYESEELETIVFDFVRTEALRWINEAKSNNPLFN